jgi:hypothetical protein
MLDEEHNISASDMQMFALVDTAEEAYNYIDEFYKFHELSPNF